MTPDADLYWSFRSPYSYLATGRYVDIARTYDLRLSLRVVYPLAIREPDFFERNHPNWLGYLVRDIARMGEFHGIPIAPPNPDPVVQDIATRKIAADQPHIHKLTRMGQAAAREGKGLEFADAVSRNIWGGVKGWNERAHMEAAANTAGLDLDKLERMAIDEADALDQEVAANQDALEASGHWGVPTLVFDGEPFFGQDRIDVALWRMKQKGLTER